MLKGEQLDPVVFAKEKQTEQRSGSQRFVSHQDVCISLGRAHDDAHLDFHLFVGGGQITHFVLSKMNFWRFFSCFSSFIHLQHSSRWWHDTQLCFVYFFPVMKTAGPLRSEVYYGYARSGQIVVSRVMLIVVSRVMFYIRACFLAQGHHIFWLKMTGILTSALPPIPTPTAAASDQSAQQSVFLVA